MIRATLPLLVAVLLLPACDKDEAPAPSAEQADRLNQAEAMLDDAGEQPSPAQ